MAEIQNAAQVAFFSDVPAVAVIIILIDIGVIHAQDSHIGATPGSALRNLSKGMIVDAQETNGSRCLPC
jgi:hypothetical protein